jgi:hypothetical protein
MVEPVFGDEKFVTLLNAGWFVANQDVVFGVRWLDYEHMKRESLGLEGDGSDVLLDVVPFASDKSGSHWVWHSGRKRQVLYCPFDDEEAEVFAPEFDSFLFRVAGMSLLSVDPDDVERVLCGVRVVADMVGGVLQKELERVISSDPIVGPGAALYWLTYEQLNDLVSRRLGDEFLQSYLVWQ